MTGAASGMGRAVAEKLTAAGHTVIDVDIVDATVRADLSTPPAVASAAAAVLERCGGRLDGAVMAAGLGPARGTGPPPADRRGQLLRRRRPARGLAPRAGRGRPGQGRRLRQQLQHDGADGARPRGPRVPRRRPRPRAQHAAALRQAGADLRLRGQQDRDQPLGTAYRRHPASGRAPGSGSTRSRRAPSDAVAREAARDPRHEAKEIKRFPVPIGGFGDAGHLADWVVFMLSDAADFLCGSVVFVDGGSDAWFRADDWPRGRCPRDGCGATSTGCGPSERSMMSSRNRRMPSTFCSSGGVRAVVVHPRHRHARG